MKQKKPKAAQIRMPQELYDEVEYYANIHDRSISSEMLVMIKNAVANMAATTHEFAKPKRKK